MYLIINKNKNSKSYLHYLMDLSISSDGILVATWDPMRTNANMVTESVAKRICDKLSRFHQVEVQSV